MFQRSDKAKEEAPKDGKPDDENNNKDDASPEAVIAGATAEVKKPGLLETMVLDIDRIVIEEGY